MSVGAVVHVCTELCKTKREEKSMLTRDGISDRYDGTDIDLATQRYQPPR